MKHFKFEDISSYQKLYEAHVRARKCKRYKNEIVKFELDIYKNLHALSTSLTNGTYRIRGYKRFMIYDPKEREIQALAYYDRVVQNSLCFNFLVPCYTKKLIYDNSACRKGKGTHFTRARVEGFMAKYFKKYGNQGYFLRIDIKKYFNNIDHQILKSKLGKIHDPKLNALVNHIIDSYEFSPGKGVPMGNQSSQVFALLYLNHIDRIIKEKFKIKYYVRYMDDLLILHNDKEFLETIFADLKQEILAVKLEINKKSEIIPLKNGIEFLGVFYKVLNSGKIVKRMKPQSKRRMVRRIKKLKSGFDNGLVSSQQVGQSLAGFKGNIKRLNVSGIQKKYLSLLKTISLKQSA